MGTASRGQETELLSAIVRGFPFDKLPGERVQYLIEHQQELAEILLVALSSTVESLFKKLLSSCHQDWVNNDITEEHFPLVDDGTGDKEILEYGFDRTVTGLQAEKELKKLGYKFIGIKRAMEYVASHPDAQKAHPLIVLGARWRSGSGVRVPGFGWDGGRRCFGLLGWVAGVFHVTCRCLVVRE